jgi:uncharacterized protein with von Willebrand factor type A (vWA) domain
MSDESLEDAFERFIQFGVLLDRRTRRYLVAYLRLVLLGEASHPDDDDLDPVYGRYFRAALDRVFDNDALITLCKEQGALGEQVAVETLRWLRQTQRTLEHNPHADEKRRLNMLAGMPLERFVARWYTQVDYLRSQYAAHELDAGFYITALREEVARRSLAELPEASRARVELLLRDLLAAWDAQLSAKLLAVQLEQLETEQEAFRSRLQRKLTEFQRMSDVLSPFSRYVGRYWDMSRELWDEADLGLLERYADLLADDEGLQRLAKLLGRMREAELETDQEELQQTIVRQHWVSDPTQRTQIVGVHESDELSHMLSGEAALLSGPETEPLFLQRFADKRLMTFQFSDRRLVSSTEHSMTINERVRRREKGPFILCVDTSYSMHGAAEEIAKVLAFGIMRIAAEEGRAAYLINFSIGIKTIDLMDVGRSLDAIAAFLRMSFNGGTDITPALSESLRKLKASTYQDADVLVISDFIMYRISDEMLGRIRHHQHNRGTRFHALTLSDGANSDILSRFDTNWLYDPTQRGVIRSLTGQLGHIRDL